MFWNDAPDLWSHNKRISQLLKPLDKALRGFKIVFCDVLEDVRKLV